MKKRKEYPGINMTPMIDVVFQMIIFFICTSDLEKKSFDEAIRLEWARDAQAVEKQNPLTVTINVRQDGSYNIAGFTLDERTLNGVMRNTVSRHGSSVPVVIRGDAQASHGSVRRVMDICKGVGIWKLSFAAIKSKG